MNPPRAAQPWIPIEKIESLVQIEPALVILGLALGSWLFYKIFLRSVSAERHRNLNRHFANMAFHVLLGTGLFLLHYGLKRWMAETGEENGTLERVTSYVGLLTIFWGTIAFVKAWRIILFEYLFLSHMKVGVPLLLVNLFSFVLSIGLAAWIGTEIFGLKLVPLLATSTVLSLVLGLALQDTLGNLFSGVALQLDKPYEIGHWIEVQGNGQKWTGQVTEISWRATVLMAFSEEAITLPNRVMAQSEISNFSTHHHPIIRSQVFRIPYGTSISRAKTALLEGARMISKIRRDPPPIVLVTEAAESWVTLKLVYYIDDFGAQFTIGDETLTACLEWLERSGIELAGPRMIVEKSEENALVSGA